ncbi:MAG: hypothetical protein JRI23_21975 [Deltaproteobacteria bacterium]|jgi:hypothetical protein|nr:hypothetical protein [Deltaproteobacteria bacterium]MBW2534627.1 hypothetical protein [Deltaproteobacteria bacterium]
MMNARLTLVLLVALALPACRWKPAPAPSLLLGDPAVAEQATLDTLRTRGYRVLSYDQKRGYLVVVSKGEGASRVSGARDISEVDPDRYSRITIQLFADGSLDVNGSGHHSSDDKKKMHVQLIKEIKQLQTAIADRALQIQASRQDPVSRL